MVKALFEVARCLQPVVIFIDEVDALLTQRSDSEHESTRRIKTEFLAGLEGVSTAQDERLLVIGATNRPQELDEAARRRFVKRLYVPLPNEEARQHLLVTLLRKEKHSLSEEEIKQIAQNTDGYSGADMHNLCKDAAFEPVRSVVSYSSDDVQKLTREELGPITFGNFLTVLEHVKPSVAQSDLVIYEEWNQKFGSVSAPRK